MESTPHSQGSLTIKEAVRRGRIITASMLGGTVVYFVVFWIILGKTSGRPIPIAFWIAIAVGLIVPLISLKIKASILNKLNSNDPLPINLGRWLTANITFYVINEGAALSVMVGAMMAQDLKALIWVIIPISLMVLLIPKEDKLIDLLNRRGIYSVTDGM